VRRSTSDAGSAPGERADEAQNIEAEGPHVP
jgi:hypothetical protein